MYAGATFIISGSALVRSTAPRARQMVMVRLSAVASASACAGVTQLD